MKAICDYTPEEYAAMRAKAERLREAISGHSMQELMECNRKYGYAHYTFTGTYTDKLVELLGREPDADEIIILVDDGFSHFGATCGVGTLDHTFRGRVNTD